ncbi:MAG: ZIP family metal transporter [Gemmatimonadales bacterium]
MRRTWLWFAVPLVLLGALSLLVTKGGTLGSLRRGLPPVEQLTVDRTRLVPGKILLDVVNGGPDPVTVAQVIVDEAFWMHTVTPDRTVPRLGRATIEIPYPWVEGEPHHIALVSANGVTFAHEIAVAAETPVADARYFLAFTLVGLYVGVLPVVIGLLWLPWLRRLERRWVHFALALTGGLLVFLAVEALHEALETAERVAGAFQGAGLVALSVLGAWLLLQAFSGSGRRETGNGAAERMRLAFLIAWGIGLHNLGEGLAIGAAYAQGAVSLGAFLIVGFMIHNTTEGLGIVAPVAQDAPPLRSLALAGLVAGAPTILGAWLGGLAYSPVLGTISLGIGAGAILQVVGVLYRVVKRETGDQVWNPLNALGVAAGLAVMYGTGLLVAS